MGEKTVTEGQLRNAYKLFHQKELTAMERDTVIKLLTRKTLFNNQHKKIFPGERPDWAKEDYCWECKEETGEQVQEDLLHSLWTCSQTFTLSLPCTHQPPSSGAITLRFGVQVLKVLISQVIL